MARHTISLTLTLSLAVAIGCRRERAENPPERPAAATPVAAAPVDAARGSHSDPAQLARNLIIVDGHIDVPHRLEGGRRRDGGLSEDISAATAKGDFDYPRAVAGGLDAPFMSIYVPVRYQNKGGARAVADRLIDMVEDIARKSPDKFALAYSPAQVRANSAASKISLPLGIENGAAIEDDLANVEHFAKRGVRYITLTHSEDNLIGDSSYATTHTHHGLSRFGKQVVAEMNRVGIMIDVSHVSDDTYHQVLATTRVPVIASHSSARKFTPGLERNMSDDMIRALRANGGVIMINFGSGFIDQEAREQTDVRNAAIKTFTDPRGLDRSDPAVDKFVEEWVSQHPQKFATVDQVADHVMHVIDLVGVDHVGFGSDFDGVRDTLPVGLKSVADYPKLIAVLQGRGLSDEDLRKVCGENLLRVWQAAEDYASR